MNGITTTVDIKDDASARSSTGMQRAGVPAPSYACGQPAAVEAKVRANFAISMMITSAAVCEVINFSLANICSR